MSRSGQAPRNGLAKALWEADDGTDPAEILEQSKGYQCPACGWEAQLRRKTCWMCEYDEPLEKALKAGETGD